jgi:hypothetical protein
MESSAKFVGMDVHKESISIAVMKLRRKASHGVHHRNEGDNHCAVHLRAARRRVRHVCRRNVGRVVVGLPEAARDKSSAVQPAEKRLAERR